MPCPLLKRLWEHSLSGSSILNGFIRTYCLSHVILVFFGYTVMNECVLFSAPPVVHAFATKSVRDPKKVRLTCLATGFYPKDVELCVRKFGTSIPEHLITSSGIRHNDDGTYQLRKSMEINGDDPTDYDCYVHHSSLTEPVMKKWGAVGGVIVILLIVLAVLFFVLIKKRMNGEYKCFCTDSV
uniref:Ig-like domain-containing protein n=1 Tax=Astyanax mexicanus TaxID=7994 RepID=A0A3B1IEV9_ASTMX